MKIVKKEDEEKKEKERIGNMKSKKERKKGKYKE